MELMMEGIMVQILQMMMVQGWKSFRMMLCRGKNHSRAKSEQGDLQRYGNNFGDSRQVVTWAKLF
jgi:hypothetical protein